MARRAQEQAHKRSVSEAELDALDQHHVATIERFRADVARLTQELAAERQRAEQAEAERDALRARVTWQPIETAPKDGTWMLLVGARWVVDGPVVGAWSSDHGGYWHDCEHGITGVTHWMPLPAAPDAALAPEQEAG